MRKYIPNRLVNIFWHLPIAWLAAARYGFPCRKLKIIGVTGTDGKTTTVYLINHILKTAGKKTAMISSIVAEIDGKESATGFHVTSPHPFDTQKYLKEAVDRGVEYAVLEVTSHAMNQYRFSGCNFKVGVITNVRPDHLDYHKTFDAYLKAKAKLLKNAEVAILNKDDNSYKNLTNLLIDHKNKLTYSIKDKTEIVQPKSLPGNYNLSNILAANTVILNLDLDSNLKKRPALLKTVNKALSTFQGVPGRFEEIKTDKDFRVIIDFAHTPYALRELLTTLRTQVKKGGRVFAVFGCAADRGDERRQMGKVSAELADLTVITAEDPRYEGVEKISDDIAAWALKGGATEITKSQNHKIKNTRHKHAFIKISDRQEAISYAVNTAQKGDIVALCGKGHEQSMNFDGTEYPWDEKKAALKALK